VATAGSSAELRLGGQGDWLAARVKAIEKADEDDLAVLEVDALASVYPVLDEDDDVVSDDDLLIFGFPRYATSLPQRSDLLPAQFVSKTGLIHLPNRVLHKFKSGRVVPGYSGSPALNLMTGKVIGVVSETLDPRANAGGWAIRSVLLAQLFPDIAAENNGSRKLVLGCNRLRRGKIDARRG
jgi:hypothetical protein